MRVGGLGLYLDILIDYMYEVHANYCQLDLHECSKTEPLQRRLSSPADHHGLTQVEGVRQGSKEAPCASHVC